MKNYVVYFEVFGKKMKTTILANSSEDAKTEVLNKVNFLKIEEKPKDIFNECVEILDRMNDFLNSHKK